MKKIATDWAALAEDQKASYVTKLSCSRAPVFDSQDGSCLCGSIDSRTLVTCQVPTAC